MKQALFALCKMPRRRRRKRSGNSPVARVQDFSQAEIISGVCIGIHRVPVQKNHLFFLPILFRIVYKQ